MIIETGRQLLRALLNGQKVQVIGLTWKGLKVYKEFYSNYSTNTKIEICSIDKVLGLEFTTQIQIELLSDLISCTRKKGFRLRISNSLYNLDCSKINGICSAHDTHGSIYAVDGSLGGFTNVSHSQYINCQDETLSFLKTKNPKRMLQQLHAYGFYKFIVVFSDGKTHHYREIDTTKKSDLTIKLI